MKDLIVLRSEMSTLGRGSGKNNIKKNTFYDGDNEDEENGDKGQRAAVATRQNSSDSVDREFLTLVDPDYRGLEYVEKPRFVRRAFNRLYKDQIRRFVRMEEYALDGHKVSKTLTSSLTKTKNPYKLTLEEKLRLEDILKTKWLQKM